MINPKVLEAWFTLMAEAARGTEQAQTAFKTLPTGDPEAWQEWTRKFMPGVGPNFSSDAFEDQLEEWYRLMGVVPRARYLAALEKNDLLQRRLERAEATIEKLRTLLEGKGEQPDEARQVLDTWSTMLNETLKTQTEWMRAWTATGEGLPEEGLPQEDIPEEAQDESVTDDTPADEAETLGTETEKN